MNKFIWTDEYSLGINVIDEQHKHFFEIVNIVYDVLDKSNATKEELLKIIDELIKYDYYHLSTEEKYFNQFFYSDMANHMKYHDMFRTQTEEYYNRLEKEDLPKLSLEVTDFAKNWLIHHIMVEDKKYVPYFKEHNIN